MLSVNHKSLICKVKENKDRSVLHPLFSVLQFQKVSGIHGNPESNKEGADGRKTVQTPRPAAALPISLTQDHLTLAVLTLLLGGWLVFVLTCLLVSSIVICT